MNHLQDKHGMDARVSEVTCPLCVEFTSRDHDVLSLHIARHMEEIALAILPSGVDSDDESADDASHDSNSIPISLGVSSRNSVVYGETPRIKGLRPCLQSALQDENGVYWIRFDYSHKGVLTEYNIRYEMDNVDVENLPHEFKMENCIYPRALVPEDQYQGDDRDNDKTWNAIGWALAVQNPSLQGRRELLQRAAETAFTGDKVDGKHADSGQMQETASGNELSSSDSWHKATLADRMGKDAEVFKQTTETHNNPDLAKSFAKVAEIPVGAYQGLPCRQCDKTFFRQSDLVRHTKLHDSRNMYRCGGALPNGRRWGCGTDFGRQDILRNHHKSKKGRSCIAERDGGEQATASAS